MSYVRTFIAGMRSAFDLAPKKKNHKANFITQANTLQVDVHVSSADLGACDAISSHMQKVGESYALKHPISKKANLSVRK